MVDREGPGHLAVRLFDLRLQRLGVQIRIPKVYLKAFPERDPSNPSLLTPYLITLILKEYSLWIKVSNHQIE